LNYPQQKAT
jgi:hypothetical protein